MRPIREVSPDGKTRTLSPGMTEPALISPENPRNSELGRLTHCTGMQNDLAWSLVMSSGTGFNTVLRGLRDAGITEVRVREATKAVTEDYANSSAHLFLSDSYNDLRDPTRFNLRYESEWFNETLLAGLLAPILTREKNPDDDKDRLRR